jgi:hypothetical protein
MKHEYLHSLHIYILFFGAKLRKTVSMVGVYRPILYAVLSNMANRHVRLKNASLLKRNALLSDLPLHLEKIKGKV